MSVGVRDGLKKLWLSAAYYGEEDICRELFKHIPAATRSSLPTKPENAMVEELCYEGELTALHLASYSGSENVVRAVLNQPGVVIILRIYYKNAKNGKRHTCGFYIWLLFCGFYII